MSSQATSDGALTLTVTFALGTDLDNAQVQVQNRVAQALPQAAGGSAAARRDHAEEFARPHHGRASHLAGPALRHAVPVELRAPARQGRAGAGSTASATCRSSAPATTRCASGWIRRSSPQRSLTAGDVINAIREQNVQVAAGALSAPPGPSNAAFQLNINTRGPAGQRGRVRQHHRAHRRQWRRHASARRRPGRARLEQLRAALPARQQAGGGAADLPAAGLQRDPDLRRSARHDGGAEEGFPAGRRLLASSTTRPSSCAARSRRWCTRCSRRSCWWCWW